MASKAQAALNVLLAIGPEAERIHHPQRHRHRDHHLGQPRAHVGLKHRRPRDRQAISGTGIAAGSVITAIPSGTTLTLSKNATATGSAVTLTVSVFVVVGELSEVPLSGNKWDVEDVTSFDSGNDKEFLKTLKDRGKIAMKLNRVSTNGGQVLLKAAYEDTSAYMFQETFPMNVDQTVTGDSVIYAGLVMQYDDTVAIGKAIKLAVEIQRTGTPAYTQGS
jgi:hypothetical protein